MPQAGPAATPSPTLSAGASGMVCQRRRWGCERRRTWALAKSSVEPTFGLLIELAYLPPCLYPRARAQPASLAHKGTREALPASPEPVETHTWRLTISRLPARTAWRSSLGAFSGMPTPGNYRERSGVFHAAKAGTSTDS